MLFKTNEFFGQIKLYNQKQNFNKTQNLSC